MRNMFEGRAKLEPLDHDRIPGFVGQLRGMYFQRVDMMLAPRELGRATTAGQMWGRLLAIFTPHARWKRS